MQPDMKLFFDGSCKLCRHEIAYLAPKLAGKLELVDISAAGFSGYQGVNRNAMLQQIHLWDGQRFIIGLSATLYYWRLAGLRFLPWLLALPVLNSVANYAYLYWAKKRLKCTDHQCDLP